MFEIIWQQFKKFKGSYTFTTFANKGECNLPVKNSHSLPFCLRVRAWWGDQPFHLLGIGEVPKMWDFQCPGFSWANHNELVSIKQGNLSWVLQIAPVWVWYWNTWLSFKCPELRSSLEIFTVSRWRKKSWNHNKILNVLKGYSEGLL